MSTIFTQILDVLFPPSIQISSDYISKTYTPRIRQIDLKDKKSPLEWIWVAHEYQDKIEDMIRRAKILGETVLINPLIDNLVNQILTNEEVEDLNQTATISLDKFLPDFICFIPPDPLRIKQRGYHLPQIIAKKLSRKLNIPKIELSSKTESTKSQSQFGKQNREKGLENTFTAKPENLKNEKITNKKDAQIIWLIDDICTTGATLYHAAIEIKQILPKSKIYGVVLAGN
jgi:predicted amidophosphoribosyltransferase